jgi:hypothetical protein
MPTFNLIPLTCVLMWACSAAFAAQGAAPPDPTLSKDARDGIRLLGDKQYRDAIEFLERARAQQPDKTVIEEQLVVAYLSVPPGPDQKNMLRGAGEAARRAIALGGCAPFIVNRGTSSRFDQNFTEGERGRLRFCKDRLEYFAERADTTFTIAPGDITDFNFNKHKGESKAAFHIKVKNAAGKATHDFRPASFTERDPNLLFELMEEYWHLQRK